MTTAPPIFAISNEEIHTPTEPVREVYSDAIAKKVTNIVNSIKKALRANGYNQQQIEDYLIEYSYCSKTRIRKLYNESIYNEDCSIKKVVECIPAFHTDKSLTDSIIDELKSRPVLLADIKKGMRADNLQRKHKINNTTLLINFYDKHKDIIELD